MPRSGASSRTAARRPPAREGHGPQQANHSILWAPARALRAPAPPNRGGRLGWATAAVLLLLSLPPGGCWPKFTRVPFGRRTRAETAAASTPVPHAPKSIEREGVAHELSFQAAPKVPAPQEAARKAASHTHTHRGEPCKRERFCGGLLAPVGSFALDKIYVTTVYYGTAHFRKNGWGFDPLDQADEFLLTFRRKLKEMRDWKDPEPVDVEWISPVALQDGVRVREGRFESPVSAQLPVASRTGHIKMVWPAEGDDKGPVMVLLPPNGDEGYDRRFVGIAHKLASEHGIASVMLEPPFYNRRREPVPPNTHKGEHLRAGQMADVRQLLMTGYGGAQEARSLLQWLRGRGHTVVGVCGQSLGAYTACLVASSLNFPVALAACLPCHSAEVCWTDSVMAQMCDFKKLAKTLGPHATPQEARQHLKGLLNELTDLTKMRRPYAPECAVMVAARSDAYVTYPSVSLLTAHWAGSELRVHKGGHVTSFVLNKKDFRRACVDSVAKLSAYLAQHGRDAQDAPPPPRRGGWERCRLWGGRSPSTFRCRHSGC